MHLELVVRTEDREQFINITPQLNEMLKKSEVKDGLLDLATWLD